MKKKITALVTVMALLMMTMAGCGSSAQPSAGGEGGQVYKIGICQQLEHPALGWRHLADRGRLSLGQFD